MNLVIGEKYLKNTIKPSYSIAQYFHTLEGSYSKTELEIGRGCCHQFLEIISGIGESALFS